MELEDRVKENLMEAFVKLDAMLANMATKADLARLEAKVDQVMREYEEGR